MEKVRVMHVDDSAVIRGIIGRILERDDDIDLVASAKNGAEGVELYKSAKPDVVIMDIEMPVMDGISALKEIMAADRRAKVIMCSTLTVDNGEMTIKAMKIGAIDYIPKPTSVGEVGSSSDFRDRLLYLVKNIKAGTKPVSMTPIANQNTVGGATSAIAKDRPSSTPSIFKGEVKLRPTPPLHWKPKVIAVGSSTGGPQALFEFMKSLKGINVPVVITQHMPATFTTLLARHITEQAGFDCVEADDNTLLENGKAILARGGKHMEFAQNDQGQTVVKLSDAPAENFCKPAVDPMMKSLTNIYGGQIMSVILTGMGSDGLNGTKTVIEKGGYCVAQDADTSVVWGMPGAVATNGVCSAVLPLTEIAQWVKDHTR